LPSDGSIWIPAAFVIACLLTLLVLPTLLYRQIDQHRQRIANVAEPARGLITQLMAGQNRQQALVREYLVTGEPSSLQRFIEVHAEDTPLLVKLRALATDLGNGAEAEFLGFLAAKQAWERLPLAMAAGEVSPAEFQVQLPDQSTRYEALLDSTIRLDSAVEAAVLATRAGIRRIEDLIRVSLLLLTLVAAAAVVVVSWSAVRFRRLAVLAERRAREEQAIREVAGELSATTGVIELGNLIVEGAVYAARADGAYLEQVDFRANDVLVTAAAGWGAVPVGVRSRYPGSLAERVINNQRPEIFQDLAAQDRPMAHHLHESCGRCPGVVVPLISQGEALGALVLLRHPESSPFSPAELPRVQVLADLMAVSFRRALVLAELARAKDEAERANRAKSDFLAVMSHELRTPLTAVLGYADILEAGVDGPLNERQQLRLQRIRTSAQHLVELIEEILTFSRLDSGREHVNLEQVDLAALARESADVVRPSAQLKALEFREEIPSQPVIALTDPAKVRRILLNLLSNAIKFTERGRVVLTLEPGSTSVAFHVHDTGIGIAPEHAEQVFEPFWQASDPLTREFGGTGLGLSVARRLAGMLGGSVSLQRRGGIGATFTVRLPRQVEARARAS
jgi:signal transduction histidine kinase